MRLFFKVLTALYLGSSVTLHAANASCQLPDNLPAQPSLDRWQAIKPLLATQLEQCLNHSDYFALYGASLLYTGNIAKSLEMLERALLINPNNGAARVDYAQALFESGQVVAALQVNDNLLRSEGIPDQLKTFLSKRHQAWKASTHYWRHQLSYLYGHSSNLNNATHIESLDLTLAGQRFPILLDESSLAQSGFYQFIGLQSQRYQATPFGKNVLAFSLKSRLSDQERSDTDAFKLNYTMEDESLAWRTFSTFEFEHIQLGGDGLYSALAAGWRIEPREQAEYYLDTTTRYIRFSNQDVLDEVSLVLSPGVQTFWEDNRLGVELSYGMNFSLNDRPGDDRTLSEVSVFYDMGLWRGRLMSRFSYTENQDSQGYSSSLENNAKRDTQAITGSLQYLYPISDAWLVHGSYYYRRQISNISLFETKHENIDIGFTYRF